MGELAKQVQQLNVQLNSASEKMDRKMTDYKVRDEESRDNLG